MLRPSGFSGWRPRLLPGGRGRRGLSFEQLGLVVHGRWRILIGGNCRRSDFGWVPMVQFKANGEVVGESPGIHAGARRADSAQSRAELIPFLALAVTAGLCEEFLYRGFAMAALTRAGLPAWSVVLLSSILFGLAHLYQGRGGLLSTLVIGTVFGTARIAYDGLFPVMLWHFAVDAVAGVAGPKYLVRAVPTTAEVEIHSPL